MKYISATARTAQTPSGISSESGVKPKILALSACSQRPSGGLSIDDQPVRGRTRTKKKLCQRAQHRLDAGRVVEVGVAVLVEADELEQRGEREDGSEAKVRGSQDTASALEAARDACIYCRRCRGRPGAGIVRGHARIALPAESEASQGSGA